MAGLLATQCDRPETGSLHRGLGAGLHAEGAEPLHDRVANLAVVQHVEQVAGRAAPAVSAAFRCSIRYVTTPGSRSRPGISVPCMPLGDDPETASSTCRVKCCSVARVWRLIIRPPRMANARLATSATTTAIPASLDDAPW